MTSLNRSSNRCSSTSPTHAVPAEELAAGKFENEKIKIRKKYTIPIDNENEITKKYIELYTNERRKDLIEKALERMGMYKDMVLSVLKEEGLPEELVYLPVVESLYKVNAYSHAGAVGLWQIMRTTGRNLGLVINYWVDERRDPEKSTRAAAKYLKELYRWFNDWHLALAAYNRGEGGIGKDLGFSKATDYYQLQDRQALPNETHMFVPKFMACTIIGDNYKDYGLDPDFEKPLQYDEVTVNNVIDLEIVAKCAGSTGGEIRKLNPAISAWCTPNNYPDFKLKLPRGAKDAFFTNIAQVKDLNPSAGVIRYTVVKGDLLGSIAKKFNTTVYAIKRDNNITNVNFIRPKQKLIIRPGRNYFSKKGRETEDED